MQLYKKTDEKNDIKGHEKSLMSSISICLSLFMYSHYISHNRAGQKPALSEDAKAVQLQLAVEFKKLKLRRFCFIDGTLVRVGDKRGTHRAWQTPEEALHSDVKEDTNYIRRPSF